MAKTNLAVTLEKKCTICGTTTDYKHSGECEVCTNDAWVYTCKSHPNLILRHRTCPVCEVEVEFNKKEKRWKSERHSDNLKKSNLRWIFVTGFLIGVVIIFKLFDSGYLQSRVVRSMAKNIADNTILLASAKRKLDISQKNLKESESNVEDLKVANEKLISSIAKNMINRKSSIEVAEKEKTSLEDRKLRLTKTNLRLKKQLNELEDRQIQQKTKDFIGESPEDKLINSLSNSHDSLLSRIRPIGMIWINSGKFTMGSSPEENGRDSDEGPQTEVTISKGFAIGKYEVTNKLYNEITEETPFKNKLPLLPVSNVSWNDAIKFCKKLTKEHRIEERIPSNYEYRLPSEAEWEFACRAGTDSAFSFGNNFIDDYAWNSENSAESKQKVGMKKPNNWGLYDMHGNVQEWVLDNYHDSYIAFDGKYGATSAVDPVYLDNSIYRIVRGGTSGSSPLYCRSAERLSYAANVRKNSTGFRIVLAEYLKTNNNVASAEVEEAKNNSDVATSIDEKKIIKLERVDKEPRPLVRVPPQYPPKLLLNMVRGRVDVSIVIDEEGNVADYQIRRSTHVEFSNAVKRVIRQWKFSPAIKDGKKVAVTKTQPFYFGKQ